MLCVNIEQCRIKGLPKTDYTPKLNIFGVSEGYFEVNDRQQVLKAQLSKRVVFRVMGSHLGVSLSRCKMSNCFR